MTKEIILSTGEVCLVDDEDYDCLNQWKWYIDRGYALKMQNDGEKRTKIRMHRLITNCPSGLEVDHINHDRLDNRKSNLRICTSKENSRNIRKIPNNGSSIYKGVSKRKHVGLTTWRMKITADYCSENVNLSFTNEIAAANAYNYYASKLFGEFACLNECPIMKKDEWKAYITNRKKAKIYSRYKGVGWNKRKQSWRAYIAKDKKQYHLGYYECENDAALAYNKAVINMKCNYTLNEIIN